MEQKHLLWPAIVIILLIAAGAIYYAMTLQSPATNTYTPSTTTPSTLDTTTLDSQATQNDQDLDTLNTDLNDYNNVNTSQDNLGI